MTKDKFLKCYTCRNTQLEELIIHSNDAIVLSTLVFGFNKRIELLEKLIELANEEKAKEYKAEINLYKKYINGINNEIDISEFKM